MNDANPLPPAERDCLSAQAHYRAALSALPSGAIPERVSFGRSVEAARRHPDALSGIAAGDAILWRVVLADDRAIRTVIKHVLRLPSAAGWDGDDLRQIAQIGYHRGLIRWRQGCGASPSTWSRRWAISMIQHAPDTGADLTGQRRGWSRASSAIALRIDDTEPGAARTYGEVLRAPEHDLDAEIDGAAQVAALRRAISNLCPRRAEILRSIYEHDCDCRTLAAQMGVSHQRIGQLRDSAMSQIRVAMGLTTLTR